MNSALRQLLQSRKRSQDKKLRERTGISSERLSSLELHADPNLKELRALANYFRVELRDLLPSHPRQQSIDLLFRARNNEIDEATSSALSRRIGSSIELLGGSSLPHWLMDFHGERKSYGDAEQAAEQFRNIFFDEDQESPLFGLPGIAVHKMGVLLFLIRSARFEGASALVEGLPFVFLAESFPPRMLFTLAHEIGHLIGHHNVGQSFAVVDKQTEKRPQASKNATEYYAHAFASCLLMPKIGVGVTLRKIREKQVGSDPSLGDIEILLLSRIYGVSFYAAARRCEDLKLIPRGGAASLNQALKKAYGSAEKRADVANLPPRIELLFPRMPSTLLQAATEKVRSGEISIGKASSILGLSIADLLSVNAPRIN